MARRHLLPVDGLELEPQRGPQFLRIVVADRWAASRAGQLLASCLVNLLCRQVKLVARVEVVSPAAQRSIQLPSGESRTDFPECLRTLAEWAVKDAIKVTIGRTEATADHTVFIGDPPKQSRPEDGDLLVVVADGWRAFIGDPRQYRESVRPTSSNAFGPFFAAALAAGEIFKRARGIRRGRFLTGDGYSLWSGLHSPDWTALEDGPEVEGLSLPPVHVVGAGAVGNALAYAIANCHLRAAYLIAIDDDQYDETNLNRCLLAGWSDLGHPKVEAIARALRSAGLDAFPFEGTIRSYVAAARNGLRPDVAREIDNLIFEIVVSCVDKGISRQDVQGLRPKLLLGGSTLDLQAKANLYTGEPGRACLGCFNPAEKDGEKFRALEDRLRKMALETRCQFLTEQGLDASAIEEYLSGAQCGGLGEAALRDFATRVPNEFSVGFVSLGAGSLLAAALLRNTVFSGALPLRGDMTTMNFLNGGVMDARLAADDRCELECQSRFSAREEEVS